MIRKITIPGCLLLVLLALAGCYDDKGNYDYEEVPLISIENIDASYSCLRNADALEIRPKITSSIEGEIAPDNPNYEYSCRLGNASGKQFDDGSWWHIINPDSTQAFTYLPTENTGNYVALYTVRDKRTDVATSYEFGLEITSSTYEGWMVLCGDGPDNRVRLDMVSVISDDRIEPIYDLLGNNSLITSLHNPTQLMFVRSRMANLGDAIYLLSEEGAYSLDREELTTDATGNLLESEFLADLQGDVPIRISTVTYGSGAYNSPSAYLAVTKNGDLYCRKVNVSGACYEFPVNVSAEGNDGEYTVAPYVTSGKNRPGDTSVALLYDNDNDRFMGWDYETNDGTTCFELPAGTVSPATTGKDLVYMEGTHLSNNTVFSILQDEAGQRSIYAINLSNDQFTQDDYIENIQAENFNQATSFAFHSQYYYMFYACQDKLYVYDLGSEALVQTISLPGEEITMVKFDLFKSPNILDIVPEEMREQQYYLLVGSYKTGSEDGGIMRMYRFNNTTKQLEEVENRKYEGFGRIVDVTYREQFIMTVPS